jgi:hypothetical protein
MTTDHHTTSNGAAPGRGIAERREVLERTAIGTQHADPHLRRNRGHGPTG